MIDLQAFSDEMTKIAASKWRRLLRAGKLGVEEIGQLTGSGLRNVTKEVEGLERGTHAVAKSHRIPILQYSGPGAKEEAVKALKSGDIREAIKKGLSAVEGAVAKNQAAAGGGAASRAGVIFIDNTPGTPLTVGLKGEDARAAMAFAKRHELMEALGTRKTLKSLLSPAGLLGLKKIPLHGWNVPASKEYMKRAPKKVLEEVMPRLQAQQEAMDQMAEGLQQFTATQIAPMGAVAKVVKRLGQKARGLPGARKLESVGARVENTIKTYPERLDKILSVNKPLSDGRISLGQHVSPMPVVEESRHLSMMPKALQDHMKKIRERGESPLLRRLGIEYGNEPTKSQQKAVMKAWEAGKLK